MYFNFEIFLQDFFFSLDIINHQIYLIKNIDAALHGCIELIKSYVSSNNYTYQVPVTWFTNIQLSAPLRQFVLFFLSLVLSLFERNKKKNKTSVDVCVWFQMECSVDLYLLFNIFNRLYAIEWPIQRELFFKKRITSILHCSMQKLFYPLKSLQTICI